MTLLKLPEAARLLNISYPTIKNWIYQGKIRSVRMPGGHHRIPQSEIDRLTQMKSVKQSRKNEPPILSAISGRNKLLGVVESVRHEGLLAEIRIRIADQMVTAIITSTSCKELGLKKGSRAYALIKSTEVMVVKA